VKFLIDAQLPARLARHLSDAGHDALHTLDLPEQNRTTDAEISRVADAEDRIVVSKDSDFRDSHLLSGSPARLLAVSTGNITNRDLLALFDEHLDALVDAFEGANLVQLTAGDLSILDKD
jgi:predicted nuclease of predicted toxin-antitoxin system